MKRLKERLLKVKSPRILDIGTGGGSFIALMTSLNDDYKEIIGIDSMERAIKSAEKNFDDDRIKFKVMAIEEMTFEKHSFDIVSLSNSLHHMQDMQATIAKMGEMVKEDGILLFNEMYSDNLSDQQLTHTYMHHFWAEIDRATGNVHNETMKRHEIIRNIEEHNLVDQVESWDLSVEEDQEINQEQKEWLKNTLDNSLSRVKDHEDYEYFNQQVKVLKDRVDNIGFKLATQLITIASTK